ncbi:hypothetical protein DASC09_052200 [Saccharomycopsis crataegensis]|uniref:Uncharacterized protein n=1 Tax=Saccharomycopsis crataegensis TaxID=43959 RepID=A0AAV5QUN4_9ASCO|nr:hypothetical protein DASC09_052200 [Saccharomycopsis crataegensis]
MSEPITKLPLLSKKNIKEVQAKVDQALAKIKAAYGFDSVELEADYIALFNDIMLNPKTMNKQQEPWKLVGGTAFQYVNGVARWGEMKFEKDDDYKEAIQDVVGKNPKLIITVLPTEEGFYCKSKLTEGSITLQIPKNKVGWNASDAGKDIESLL